MIEYYCPICQTRGVSKDDEKSCCPNCTNGIREGRPEISFKIKRIGQPERKEKACKQGELWYN